MRDRDKNGFPIPTAEDIEVGRVWAMNSLWPVTVCNICGTMRVFFRVGCCEFGQVKYYYQTQDERLLTDDEVCYLDYAEPYQFKRVDIPDNSVTPARTPLLDHALEKTMVDNQHKKIKGYRDLTEEEIALMNEVKEKGAELGELIDKLQAMHPHGSGDPAINEAGRWISIGRTHLQQGLMALTRAIAKPNFF